jgi:hypothetical protein
MLSLWKRALTLGLTLLILAAACDVEEEVEESPAPQTPARSEQSNVPVCAIAASALGLSTGAGAVAIAATAGCAFGAVTTEGLIAPLCVIPISADALFLLTTVATGASVYIACENPDAVARAAAIAIPSRLYSDLENGIKVYFAGFVYKRAQCQCYGAAGCEATIDIPMSSKAHNDCTAAVKLACGSCKPGCSTRSLGCDGRSPRPDHVPDQYRSLCPGPVPTPDIYLCPSSSACGFTEVPFSGHTLRRAGCDGARLAQAREKLWAGNQACYQCDASGWVKSSGCKPDPTTTPGPGGGTPTP